MNKWTKRGIQAALVAGGLLALGAGVAAADPGTPSLGLPGVAGLGGDYNDAVAQAQDLADYAETDLARTADVPAATSETDGPTLELLSGADLGATSAQPAKDLAVPTASDVLGPEATSPMAPAPVRGNQFADSGAAALSEDMRNKLTTAGQSIGTVPGRVGEAGANRVHNTLTNTTHKTEVLTKDPLGSAGLGVHDTGTLMKTAVPLPGDQELGGLTKELSNGPSARSGMMPTTAGNDPAKQAVQAALAPVTNPLREVLGTASTAQKAVQQGMGSAEAAKPAGRAGALPAGALTPNPAAGPSLYNIPTGTLATALASNVHKTVEQVTGGMDGFDPSGNTNDKLVQAAQLPGLTKLDQLGAVPGVKPANIGAGRAGVGTPVSSPLGSSPVPGVGADSLLKNLKLPFLSGSNPLSGLGLGNFGQKLPVGNTGGLPALGGPAKPARTAPNQVVSGNPALPQNPAMTMLGVDKMVHDSTKSLVEQITSQLMKP